MPLFIGTRGNDILRWSASSQLVSGLEELLSQRWERQSIPEAAALLRQFQGGLDEELAREMAAQRELEEILREVEQAATTGELAALSARGTEFARNYFTSRRSILAHFEINTELHDRIVARSIALTRELMRSKGQGEPPAFALLVSGDRGRGEHGIASGNHYFLLHEEAPELNYLFIHGAIAALKEAGVIQENPLWHGTLGQWERFVAGTGEEQGADDLQREQRLETLADLGPLLGDESLGHRALDLARDAVQRERNGDLVQRLGRKAVAAPVAVGLFGRYRLLKEGEQRGKIDLDGTALLPLQATLRVLALEAGIGCGGTLERIQWLVERGSLSVELAERLLKAFQILVQWRVAAPGNGGRYLDPANLDEAQDEQFRGAVDAVLTLQKIAYQKIFGQG
ncbi:putative nucleotidyltransferase substrate binding domain-containing protein [Geomesophilobacter sediminis]|uniref:Nucleotidyltransferase n=1 Tax=Geomesophilobacter sediminis TaxID=2798584 RepID=A0A8J7INZ0_9BACT|nr:putative nucleotidyltransferase substrate binding domain-containing protein [Geomesophilobacter sediminis]MBJ6725118.1 nucleotidyltransferase [Geomesophilobacter sediminis]